MVAKTCSVIIAATIAKPAEGTPRRLTRAKILANNPSLAAACAVCPTNNVQPAKDPRHPMAAHTATTFPATGPSAMLTACENGADDTISSLLGIIPIIAEELRT